MLLDNDMLVAARSLTTQSSAGKQDIAIRIHAPEPDRGSWICRIEINWPDRTQDQWACGVDAVQTLTLALKMIGAILYASDLHEARNLE